MINIVEQLNTAVKNMKAIHDAQKATSLLLEEEAELQKQKALLEREQSALNK